MWVSRTFRGAQLLESHSGNLKFRLPPQDISLANLFRSAAALSFLLGVACVAERVWLRSTIEQARESLSVVEYSVSQTTLEQVFMHFAKQQLEEEERHANAAHLGAPAGPVPGPGPAQPGQWARVPAAGEQPYQQLP
jgi:hypothetical protein